jgi:hypothetical protein
VSESVTISEMKAEIKLCARTFNLITFYSYFLFVHGHFPDCWIGRRGPHSPDLTCLGFSSGVCKGHCLL